MNKSTQFLSDIKLSTPITPEMIDGICKMVEKNLGEYHKSEYKNEGIGHSIHYSYEDSFFNLRTGPGKMSLSFDVHSKDEKKALTENICLEIEDFLPIQSKNEKLLNRSEILSNTKLKVINKTPGKLRAIYLLTTMVAFCSLVYELLLAQTLSSIMGDTALRYNITIGLYIASLGFGALFYSKLKTRSSWQNFCYLEIILAFVGGIGPLVILSFDFLLRGFITELSLNNSGAFFFWGSSIFNHLIIILVGFLSGIELPLLMSMGEKIKKSSETRVLSFDYLGSMIGAIVFPLFLVNYFHLFSISYFIGLFNAACALLAAIYFKNTSKKIWIACMLPLLLFIFMMYFGDKLNPYFTEVLFMKGL